MPGSLVFKKRLILCATLLIAATCLRADGSGGIAIANWPPYQNVGGTMTAVQPIGSNLHVVVDSPLTVTGTFWPTIQPVSGTFWQTTQPVSIAAMPSTPVTGTFWPATQPVSVASMPSTPVTGTFWAAPSSSANVNRVTVGTTVVTLLASNPSRRLAIIFNETGTLRVKLGPNASLTDYTYEILASAGNNRQEVGSYSGIITAIKTSGISAVQVTDF